MYGKHMLTMKKPNGVILIFFFVVLAVTSCSQKSKMLKDVPVPGPEVAQTAVSRIDSLLGYDFSWKFSRKQTGMMPGMRADLQGKVAVPDRIYIRGTWKTGDTAEKLDNYSIEGREYKFNESLDSWERGSTGSFLDPHEHLKLVLSFGEFSFEEFDAFEREDCYVFAFKPNVYFLDPVETSEPRGLVWISIERRIPVRVQVVSGKGILTWDMSLSGIDSFADITVPFNQIRFRVHEIGAEDVALITERFLYLGFQKPDVITENGSVVFAIKAEYLSDTLLTELLTRGAVDVYLCTWPIHPIYMLSEDTSLVHEYYGEHARLLFERGVVTKPIIAMEKVFSHGVFRSFELKNDLLGDFSIYGVLTPDAMDSIAAVISKKKEEPVLSVIDGEAMLISNIRDAWMVEQRIPVARGLEGKEAVRIFSRLRREALEKDYSFTRIEKEE
jgi:hypothetical protein